MSEKQTKDDVLKLIQLIDGNRDKTFRTFDVLRETPFLIMFVTFIALIFLVVYSFSALNPFEVPTLGVAFIALMISFFLYFEHFREEVVVRVNFKILEVCVEESSRPLLKALLKMKAKNERFDLERIYNFNKDMFTKEKLMERLCE
jgi:hypothetical protein